MLGLLYGCKRQLLDPLNPQNNLPQKAQFDKVKAFYENGRYKNQPKNSNLTSADSARFRDFEPNWDKTEVELLPNNKKMLIVPIVRYLNVSYVDSSAFIRRLVISIDEEDNLLEASVVEILGNLNFVPNNYKNIFKNYKNASISGFSGAIIIHEIDYDYVLTKEYTNGNFIRNTLSQYVVANINERGMVGFACTFGVGVIYQTEFCEIGEDHIEICYWKTTAIICNSDPAGSNAGTVFGGNGNTPSPGTPSSPAGGTIGVGNTGVSSGPSGSTPSGGSSGSGNTPYIPPTKDTGISWEQEIEEEVILPLPNNVVIDASWDRSIYEVKFKCILNKLLQNSIVQAHLHAHYTPANPLRIKFDTISSTRSMWTNANFDEMNNTITVNSDKYNIFNDAPDAYLATTVFYEIIHSFIHGVIKDYAIANPTLNFQLNGASSSNPDVVMIHNYYYGAGRNYYIMGDASQAHHNLMADNYLTTIAQFACSFAGLPAKPNNINALLPLAWKGLNINEPGVQVVTKWANMTPAEQKSIGTKIENINKNALLRNSTSNCN